MRGITLQGMGDVCEGIVRELEGMCARCNSSRDGGCVRGNCAREGMCARYNSSRDGGCVRGNCAREGMCARYNSSRDRGCEGIVRGVG